MLPFSTVSRLLLSPLGCVVAVCTPSVGLITNFLVKTSQGGISKFITRSLFFKINKFSHIVISFLPVKFFNNLSPYLHINVSRYLNPSQKLRLAFLCLVYDFAYVNTKLLPSIDMLMTRLIEILGIVVPI